MGLCFQGHHGRVVIPKPGPVPITLSMTVETYVGISGGGQEGENTLTGAAARLLVVLAEKHQ